MMDVRRLRLLLELTRRGTITAVAEALDYTPSAVSQQLAALEREAGVPLLERAGRRVALTPAGLVLARYAESVLATLEEASAALAATRSALTGPLRVGAFPSAAHTILPPALVALGRDHPGLELMVSELDPAAVPDALRAGVLDVAHHLCLRLRARRAGPGARQRAAAGGGRLPGEWPWCRWL